MRILACDSGSSSYKAALYEVYAPADVTPPTPLWSGEADWRRIPGPVQVREHWSGRAAEQTMASIETPGAAVEALFRRSFGAGGSDSARSASRPAVDVAAHRVVHGGRLARQSAVITDEIKSAIQEASPLAPEHNSIALAGMNAVGRLFGSIEQIAIFDSEFHATLPEAAYTYATPLGWRDVWGMRRLGFHGISHRYCAERCAQLMGSELARLKIVSCHLGNGCSLAAIDGGRSIDTTMGWTPLEGLVMGQRSGDVDPGIMLHLIDCGRFTAAQLRRVLNEESGLKGVSGLSGDMREILAAMDDGHPRAKLAFDVYVHRLRRAIGAMIASLGGLDALVFTGGVGENAPAVREAVCTKLESFGLDIDRERNRAFSGDGNVAVKNRRIGIFVIRSEERWALARECFRILQEALKV